MSDSSSAEPVYLQQRVIARLRAIPSWWDNPLLKHARRTSSFPWIIVRLVLIAGTLMVTMLAIAAWMWNSRLLGAILMVLSLGTVLTPLMVAPLIGARRIVRQMHDPHQDPRRLTDLDPQDVVWGLVLVTLWRLRWMILVGLVFTPVLMLGVLRMDLSDYQVWRESAAILGQSSPGGQAGTSLLTDGRIPYFRLIIRALSMVTFSWIVLPLETSVGVIFALWFRDSAISPLIASLSGVVLSALVLFFIDWLTRGNITPDIAIILVLIITAIGLIAANVRVIQTGSGFLTVSSQ